MPDQRNLMFHRADFEKLVQGCVERDGVGLVLTSEVDYGFMLDVVLRAATASYNRLASKASEQRRQVAEPRLKVAEKDT